MFLWPDGCVSAVTKGKSVQALFSGGKESSGLDMCLELLSLDPTRLEVLIKVFEGNDALGRAE